MNHDECRHEEEILEALTSDVWTDELEHHVRTCPDCADLVEVDRALQAEARVALEDPGLPDAQLIWRRFELETEQRRLREATLPIRLLERLALGTGLAVAIYGLITFWPVLGTWLLGAGSSLADLLGGATRGDLLPAGMSLGSLPDLVGGLAFSLLCFAALLGVLLQSLYARWAET